MHAKTLRNWSGLIAISWMMIAFVVIHYVIVPQQVVIGPFWPWIFAVLAAQLIPGLLLAIAGLRCGNLCGRISAILAIGLFSWFVWYGALPAVSVLLQMTK
jgi:hypothetical protein